MTAELDKEILGWLQDHGPAKNWVIRLALRKTGALSHSEDASRSDRALQRLRKAGKIWFTPTRGWELVNKPVALSSEQLDARRWNKLKRLISDVGCIRIDVMTINGDHQWRIEEPVSKQGSKGRTLEAALDVLEVPSK